MNDITAVDRGSRVGFGSPQRSSCSVLSRNLGQLFQEEDGKATKGCLSVIARRRARRTALT